jgi:hypothetical protein
VARLEWSAAAAQRRRLRSAFPGLAALRSRCAAGAAPRAVATRPARPAAARRLSCKCKRAASGSRPDTPSLARASVCACVRCLHATLTASCCCSRRLVRARARACCASSRSSPSRRVPAQPRPRVALRSARALRGYAASVPRLGSHTLKCVPCRACALTRPCRPHVRLQEVVERTPPPVGYAPEVRAPRCAYCSAHKHAATPACVARTCFCSAGVRISARARPRLLTPPARLPPPAGAAHRGRRARREAPGGRRARRGG